MSVSMYRNQVDSLTRDLAGLEGRLADERGKAVKERGEALRIGTTISATTSTSTLRQRMRDAQRKEERAASFEKSAARLNTQIASKRRSLTMAQASLDRALKQERDREERDSKRRRQDEIRHLADLERRQRTVQSASSASGGSRFSRALFAPESPVRQTVAAPAREYEYDLCLSFAGEDRAYVEMVARELKATGVRVFYDQDETVNLWGKELTEHFDHVYRQASRYCVVFVSEAYASKEWTRLERRAALARAVTEENEYILPVRFDDTELPGLRPTVAYVDLREFAPATLVKFLLEKVGSTKSA